MTSVPSLNQIGQKLAKLAHREIFGWLANSDSKHKVITSYHTKYQLDSSKHSQVIPLHREKHGRRRRRHPSSLNYSPQRKVC